METSPCHNSVAGHQIATNFCTCHDSTAVMPCDKFCSNHCIRIEVRVKRNFHRIWIAMEKPLVKRAPGPDFTKPSQLILYPWIKLLQFDLHNHQHCTTGQHLTHLPLDKMAAILQTTVWKAFSWMQSFIFQFKFLWSLFPRVQLTILQHWFR